MIPHSNTEVYYPITLKSFGSTTFHACCTLSLIPRNWKQLNYGQLINHPKFQETWNRYFSNEMGGLCQGVGKENKGIGKRVEGTNTFYVIKFEDIARNRLNEI